MIQVSFTDYMKHVLWPIAPGLGDIGLPSSGVNCRGFEKQYYLFWIPWLTQWKRFMPGEMPSVGIIHSSKSDAVIDPYIWQRDYILKLFDDDLYLKAIERVVVEDRSRTLELHKIISNVDTVYTGSVDTVDLLLGQFWYHDIADGLIEIIDGNIQWET